MVLVAPKRETWCRNWHNQKETPKFNQHWISFFILISFFAQRSTYRFRWKQGINCVIASHALPNDGHEKKAELETGFGKRASSRENEENKRPFHSRMQMTRIYSKMVLMFNQSNCHKSFYLNVFMQFERETGWPVTAVRSLDFKAIRRNLEQVVMSHETCWTKSC